MMKEADSSGILQKLNKTCICTTSEINNDYATKDHSYTQNIVTIAQEITSMKKKKKKKKQRRNIKTLNSLEQVDFPLGSKQKIYLKNADIP